MAHGFSPARGASVEVLDAARPGLHRTHIALLAQSRNGDVRATIASRDDVPLGLQAALAQDEVTEVRSAMAANAHTVRSVLDYLRSDKNKAVLASLLANPSTPFSIVDSLAFHRRAGVRRLAIARLNDAEWKPRVEGPRDEDAKFPELRERASLVEIVEIVEKVEEVVDPEPVAHEFAVVNMGAHGTEPVSVIPPSRFAPPGAAPEPAGTHHTSPAHRLRVPAPV